MKKLIVPFMAAMLTLSACSSSVIENSRKELEDTITNAVNTDNKYVLMVKGGHRESNPGLTFDEAFTKFFGTPRWSYFESEDGQDVVEFTGDCTYQEVDVKARLQFVIDGDNGTFEAVNLALNEVPQNTLMMNQLIERAFEEAEEEGRAAEPSDPVFGDVIYEGTPLYECLGLTPDVIIDKYGTSYEYGYAQASYFVSYPDVAFLFDTEYTGCTFISSETPGVLSVNGKALADIEYSELVSTLEPDYIYDHGEGQSANLEIYYEDHLLYLELDETGKTTYLCMDSAYNINNPYN